MTQYNEVNSGVFVEEGIPIEEYKAVKIVKLIFQFYKAPSFDKSKKLEFGFPVDEKRRNLIVSRIQFSRESKGDYIVTMNDPAISSNHGFIQLNLNPAKTNVSIFYTDNSSNGTMFQKTGGSNKIIATRINKSSVELKEGSTLSFRGADGRIVFSVVLEKIVVLY